MRLLSTAAASGPTGLHMEGNGAKAQAIGPSRGGQTTKIHALTDVLGRPFVLLLTPGNASDVTITPAVLAEAPDRIRCLRVDKGYDTDWLRTDLRRNSITSVIFRKRRIRHDWSRYRERWRIEAKSSCLKDFRRIATRCDSVPGTTPQPSLRPLSSRDRADRVQTLDVK